MDNVLINTAQISTIDIYLKRKNHNYEYRNPSNWFGLFKNKCGFYYYNFSCGYEWISNEEIEKDNKLYIENNAVYYKPYIVINSSDDSSHRIYFNDEETLNNYIKSDIFKDITFIEKNHEKFY